MLEKLFSPQRRQEGLLYLPEPKKDEHTHQFEVVGKTYAPPAKLPSTENITLLQNAIFGLTTYLFQCVVCKEFKKEAMHGSDTYQLDDLMEKADTYGPQYIQRDDRTYVVMRYVPQPSVPIR